MLMTVEGRLGSGKTLTATTFVVLDYLEAGRHIVSNYHLKGVPFTFLDYELFLSYMKNDKELKNTSVVLDEAYLFVDSRMSQTGFSKLMTYFVMQTRKRDVDLYVTTQQYENVDIRLRRNTDIRALCRFNKSTQICRVRLIDLRSGKRRKIKIYGPNIYDYYDTTEYPKLRPGHIDNVKL